MTGASGARPSSGDVDMTSTVQPGTPGHPQRHPAPPAGPWAPPPAWAAVRHPYPGPYAGHPAGLPGPMPAAPRPRWGWIALGAVGLLLVVALLGSLAAAQRTITVPGSVTLSVTWSTLTPGTSCTGAGLNSWLAPGAPVTITDADGDLVGTATLGDGTAASSGGGWSAYADQCVFPFTLTGVPAQDDFYRVSVGSGAAAGVPFTLDELETTGAHLTYGS